MPARVITFKADDELIEKLDKLAKILGETRSNIIRKAVIRYIESGEYLRDYNKSIENIKTNVFI